jgi:hypothetical protein
MNLAIINKNTLGRDGFFIFLLLVTNHISAQTYTPGNTYFDPANHVEYLAGNLPIVLSAPHDGGELPDSIQIENAMDVCSFAMGTPQE